MVSEGVGIGLVWSAAGGGAADTSQIGPLTRGAGEFRFDDEPPEQAEAAKASPISKATNVAAEPSRVLQVIAPDYRAT